MKCSVCQQEAVELFEIRGFPGKRCRDCDEKLQEQIAEADREWEQDRRDLREQYN